MQVAGDAEMKNTWSRRAGKGLVKSMCCISLSPELEALTGPSRLHNEQFTCGPPLDFPPGALCSLGEPPAGSGQCQADGQH